MAKKDLDSMLNAALAGSEDSGEGDFKSILNQESINETPFSEPQEPVIKEPTTYKEPQTEPTTYQEPVIKEPTTHQESVAYKEPEKASVYQEPVTYKEPVYQNTTSYVESSFSNTTLTADKLNSIISLVDKYRNLDPKIQDTLMGLIQANKTDSIGHILSKAISMNKTTVSGLIDLVDLKKQEPVTRAFNLMSMDNYKLDAVSNFVLILVKEYKPKNNTTTDKISFCRDLERAIERLPKESLIHLEPISALLESALVI